MDPIKRQKIAERLRDTQDTILGIAKMLHVGRDTVRRVCREDGIRPLKVPKPRIVKRQHPVTELRFKQCAPKRCANGHLTYLEPCPTCTILEIKSRSLCKSD
jgi:hypothetical protein